MLLAEYRPTTMHAASDMARAVLTALGHQVVDGCEAGEPPFAFACTECDADFVLLVYGPLTKCWRNLVPESPTEVLAGCGVPETTAKGAST